MQYLCAKQGDKEFPVGAIYYSVDNGPPYGRFQPCLSELIACSDQHGQVSARGPSLEYGEVKFNVLYPKEIITEPSKNKNRDSIVVSMTYKNVTFLFTGDTEKPIERGLEGELKSTVLQVAHHGASTSTDKQFLSMVAPSYAIISCYDRDSNGRTYGHPHESTLKALKAQDVKLYRTDLSGTIVMKTDGEQIEVTVDTDVPQDSPQLWEPGVKQSRP